MAPRPPSKLGSWYAKFAAFKVEDLFSRHKTTGPPRTVYVNQPLPEHYFNPKGQVHKEHIYATNQVITSKYTIITFLPRNLLEQFRRVANVFFLAIAILQFFHQFSTISPGLVILPLLIVIGFTAIKDGYEDIKRHQSDRQVNHTSVRVLTAGSWSNHNAVEAKSKTFTRGLLPRRSKAAKDTEAQQGMSDVESEPELDNYDDSESLPEQHTLRHPHLFHHDDDSRAHWHQAIWEDVKVGDFVKIMDDEPIPADILICATSEEDNVAYVETKNLDGETNLKSRNAVEALTHLRNAAVCASEKGSFWVECDSPDVNMYKMSAAVEYRGSKYPVDLQETLLRGTVLRNTKWVIGVVLFTGQETKIVMNSGGTPSKRSKVERQMNPQVFINLMILGCMAVACAIVDAILEQRYFPLGAPWLYGATRSDDNPRINGLITWAFALITFQNIVPISLYISIEFVRICQAAFIYFDTDIMYQKTGQATQARTWNLSDDLGQIEYIFSDKTGTLTQNLMVFRQCSINGKTYTGTPPDEKDDSHFKYAINDAKFVDARMSSSTGETSQTHKNVPDPMASDTVKVSLNRFVDADLNADIDAAHNVSDNDTETVAHLRQLNGFFSVLALCHSVITSVDPVTQAIEYKAQSPDEAALVQAAADVGFVFRGRDREVMRLQTPFSQDIEEYELLNILEFTSARKRMSVLLRRRDGDDNRVFLLCKGADNVIFERLKEGNQDLKDTTEKHLDLFASEGLRTLTLAYKVVPDEEYNSWSEKYHKAEVSLNNREEQIEAVSDLMERDLRLLGATAIEDRLQDGVPETIADLKKAGIKIWVATGDKLETAIAIGHSTNLIGPDSNIIIVRGGDEKSRSVYQQMITAVEEFFPESGILEEHSGALAQDSIPRYSSDGQRPKLAHNKTGMSEIVGRDNGDRPGGFVLVVDGAALTHAFSDEIQKDILLRLAMLCEGVICCRVSPLQKALVVKLVKDGLDTMTLAIGDGANDVSMIQAADVGVGISGEEGLQAVNSSDYAIAQFRFLKKLLLVHGHWSYARNGTMILNFFYKNLVCIGVLWWFQIYDGWSSNYAFEYTYLLFWNSFWTIAPVIGIGVFDRFVDYHVLMEHPQLYRFGREGTWFNMKLFGVYMFEGLFQSAIIYFLINYAYFPSPTARSDGYQIDLYEFSTTMVLAAVLAANLFNGLNTAAWTGWVFFAVWIGTILVWAFTAIYSIISPGWISTFVYGNDSFLFPSAFFWFGIIITVTTALLPRYLYKAYKSVYDPDDIEILRYVNKYHPDRLKDANNQMEMRGLAGLKRASSTHSMLHSRASRASSIMDGRPSFDPRSRSRTDMSTGLRSVHRGFDFADEEGGVAMRRMQTNLSEVRNSSRHLVRDVRTSGEGPRPRRGTISHIFTIRKGKKSLKKRKSEKRD